MKYSCSYLHEETLLKLLLFNNVCTHVVRMVYIAIVIVNDYGLLRMKRSFALKVVCHILAGETEKATNTVVGC
jgi:hypothetical protein